MHRHQDVAVVNGTRLYYETAGSGNPLVLIHGNTLDSRMWDDQFDEFASHYKVVRYDMRGYGQSDLPSGTPYAPAEDLRALLSHLDISHAHILGLSRGGAVAIDFALTYPEATDSLILADTGFWKFSWIEFGEFSSQVREAAVTYGIEVARERWLEGALFAPAMECPKLAARLNQMVAAYSGWHWVNDEALVFLDPPPIQQLDTIAVPTLVLVGERDIQDFNAIADVVQQRIPNAVKLVLPGVGHVSNMEDPAHFNAVVLDFLALEPLNSGREQS
jgi:pimeloyl-ACP methyl ester carboxylesterase